MTEPALRFAAAVFDCDGLLVDTRANWRFAFERAAGEGLPDELLEELAGASTRTAAVLLTTRLGRAIAPEQIEAGLMQSLRAHSPELLPGVSEFLASLASRLKACVATNGPEHFVRAALGDAASRFECIITSDEAGADKPDPAPYLAACTALDVSPQEAVAFEDSAVGADSARDAGLKLVVVNPGRDRPAGDVVVERIDDPRVYAFLQIPSSANGQHRRASDGWMVQP
jgi:HAD superfamily hydrolase (TIGR01509 family)